MTHRLWSANWDILEHFLAQCAVQFPHSFDYVARVIAWRVRTDQAIDKSLWVEVTSVTASQNGKLGRDSEAVWAIWLLKEMKQALPKTLSDLLLTNAGALVLSFLAHFPKHRFANDKALYGKLRDIVEGDPFAGAFWPVTLELNHLGEGDPAWTSSSTVGPLRILHEALISIINWDAPPKVFSEAPTGDGDDDDEPDYAIEDYGSDYADEEEEEEEEEEIATADLPV